MTRPGLTRWAVALSAFTAITAMAAARAWTSDDAFITFRVVEQWLAGHGPVFNQGERVQVFTHPLWLGLLTLWRATGLTLFPGAMALSVMLFAAGLAVLAGSFRDKPAALATCATLLFFSRAFVDFASGGLETPLSFMLFAFAAAALRAGRSRLALACLCLLPLNRLDLLPWALPFAWLAAGRTVKSRLLALAWLAAPALAYAALSTLYYGAPLPNTANAKLAGPLLARLDQGLGYVVASLAVDAGSLALAIAGAGAAVTTLRMARARPFGTDERLAAAGLAAAAVDLAYAVWAGGDFMLGRFILPALWALALALLASFPTDAPRERRRAWAAACLVSLAVLTAIAGNATAHLEFGANLQSARRGVVAVGALDERRFYLPWFGAYSPFSPIPEPEAPLAATPRLVTSLGWSAYSGKLAQAYVDLHALADPLLARILPVGYDRPGHGYRPWPRDFWHWREEGYRFGDPRLDDLASDLRLAHLAPISSPGRFAAIVRLAFAPWLESGVLIATPRDGSIVFDMDLATLSKPFAGAEAYEVRLRLFDEVRVEPPVDPPVMLDAACRPYVAAGDLSRLHAIVVPGRGRFSLSCPRGVLAQAPLLLSVGVAPREGRGFKYSDEVTVIWRPSAWWLGDVPGWLTHGWRDHSP